MRPLADLARPAPEPGTRMPLLDGLRGVAIVLVVMHNFSVLTHPGSLSARLLAAWLDRGWIGVQLFFVLSGFLITGILLDTQRAENHFRSFYIRRVLRIFPMYYLTLVVIFLVMPTAWHGMSLDKQPQLLSLWFFASNWFMPLAPPGPGLPHFWSLAVEEQFYLMWPLLLYRRTPAQVLKICIAVALVALGTRAGLLLFTRLSPEAAYQFTLCRMDALAYGAMAAAYLRLPSRVGRPPVAMRQWAWAAVAVLLAGALLTGGYGVFGLMRQTVGYTALGIAAALFLLACSQEDNRAFWQRPLRWRWLQACGRYSYSMYVLHLPIHLIGGIPLLKALGLLQHDGVWPTLPYVLLGSLLSFGVGAAFYHLVEAPFLRLKSKFPATNPMAAARP